MKISNIQESPASRPVVIGSGVRPQDIDKIINSVKHNLKVTGDDPAQVLQNAIDMLADREQTRMSQNILGDISRIISSFKIAVGAGHYKKLQAAIESTGNTDVPLNEIDMSPSALAKFAQSADKFGVRAGFEAELLFTGIGPAGDDGESEPDYDADESISWRDSMDELKEFFSETMSRNNRVWSRMEDEYMEALGDKAEEFVDENIDERLRERVEEEYDKDDMIYNYLSSNGYSDEEIDKIIEAGNRAPDFSTTKDQIAYQEENALYGKWLEAQSAVEDDLESAMDGLRKQVSDDLREEFYGDNEYTIGQWLNDQGINSMSELSNEYELDWPHWTTQEEYEAFDEDEMISAADALEDMVGMDVRVSTGYHNATRRDNQYIIEPDSSLEPDDPSEHASAEIISPPMPLNQMIEHVRKVAEWANDHGGYTNKSTGLHVGVSLPDMSKVDYVKLAILVGDEYVLKTFGRELNRFCQSVFKKIAGSRNEQTVAQSVDALKTGMFGVASTALKYTVFKSSGTTDKYVSLNWKNQYIEFRSMGGDYLNEVDKIVNTVYRYVRAIVSAADPEMDRKEYLTKLYKLVQKANEDLKAQDAVEPVNMIITKYLAGEVGKDTIQKYKQYFQQVASARKDPDVKPTHPDGEMQRWRVSTPMGSTLVVNARNKTDAIKRARLQSEPLRRVEDDRITVEPIDQPAPQATIGEPRPAGGGEWTGQWLIKDAQGRVLHRFGGIGNVQSDANRHAASWLGQNRPDLAGQGIEVVPEMR